VKQTRLLTRRAGKYDPPDLGAYEELGGLDVLKRILGMDPAEIIEQIKKSGLTGRGGAGFATGAKWESAAKQKGRPKYFICNADEGELGTFKDKILLDEDPWSILEAMLIGAYATGAEHAYIYIKGEYEDTFSLWESIAEKARQSGLIGPHILGSDFSLELHVAKGRGLYIAGEEFALIASLETRRAMSNLKPPYPTEEGLFARPTVVNNVETLANIPVILEKGGEQYRQFGTEGDPGTRLFSLSGDVRNRGVYELEIGCCSLREFIEQLGGGTSRRRLIKAVQPGGGTSALLKESSLDCTLSSEGLRKAGSSIGTGGVIVYEEPVSAVEIVAKLLEYYGTESCGRCFPCRTGTAKMSRIIEDIKAGKGQQDDIERLGEIANAAVKVSTCGMGQAFPLPVLSALRLFPEDFEAAIRKTPAKEPIYRNTPK